MRQLTITNSITTRENISLDKYLMEVSKEKLISAEEEVLLAQRIRKGDQVALDKLVKANLRFVVSVAKQYQNKGTTLSDLINEGNLGLIKAARKFDETRGFKFISYAVWWIRQSMIQSMASNSRMIRLPLNRHSIIVKIKKGSALLEQQLEREPTAEEIASFTELNIVEVEDGWVNAARTSSIDAPLSSGEGQTFADITPGTGGSSPDHQLLHDSLHTDVVRLLGNLSPREAKIIRLYFGIGAAQGLTLDEIGSRMNLTRERVRQVKETAIRQLRRKVSKDLLMNYLG